MKNANIKLQKNKNTNLFIYEKKNIKIQADNKIKIPEIEKKNNELIIQLNNEKK